LDIATTVDASAATNVATAAPVASFTSASNETLQVSFLTNPSVKGLLIDTGSL
jgi:hypothetical protein